MTNGIVVVDTSLVIKWFLEEENSYIADSLQNKWLDEGKIVYSLPILPFEAANGLYKRVRKRDPQKKITLQQAQIAVQNILRAISNSIISINNNSIVAHYALEVTDKLQLQYPYDCFYLALALHENCELWTADKSFYEATSKQFNCVHLLSKHII